MKKNILENRKWDIQGNWYEPKYKLQSYKSVLHAELLDTTSSAGDWNGMFFQLINNTVYVIPFSQTNNYPNSGYTLLTEETIYSYPYSLHNIDKLHDVYNNYCNGEYSNQQII